MRRHGRSEIRAGILDSIVMMIPVIVLLVEYVVHSGSVGGGSWAARVLAALYPLLDVVMLAAIVWLLAAPTLSRAHLELLAAGMALTLLADTLFAVEVQSPSAELRDVLAGIYPLTYALLAAGVVTGSATRLGLSRSGEIVHWGRVGVLAFGALLGPVVVVIAAMPPEPLPVLWVAVAVVATSTFIIWRMVELARILSVTTRKLARARRELEVQVTHDPLTGLMNRAVLDDVLKGLEDPDSRPAALLSIDLDHFKSVNDTYGHAAGDAVLRAAANRLRASVRTDDLVMRTGGDEFLAVAHRLSREEVDRTAQRIVAAIEEPILHDGRELRVSASVGVAILPPEAEEELPARTMARADAAMYESKRSGGGPELSISRDPGAPDTGDADDATVGTDERTKNRKPARGSIRNGELSAIEALEDHFATIDRLNPILNAVCFLDESVARSTAARVDDIVAAGRTDELGPFAGVPILIKDLNDVEGWPTTSGSRATDDQPKPADDLAVARLRDAGFVFSAKTTTPEFGSIPVTESERLGATRNPWNPAHTPGGSSGGAGAAVASGMVTAAHASDGGGSIRIPANCTGLVGMKASRNRITTQVTNMIGASTQGILTRDVADQAAIIDVLAGEDRGAWAVCPPFSRPLAQEVGADPGRLRIRVSMGNALGMRRHADRAWKPSRPPRRCWRAWATRCNA